jgi:ATP synthase F1 delta subunit
MKEIDLNKLLEMAGEDLFPLEEGLCSFSNLLRGSQELRLFFENPLVPAESKKRVFAEIFPGSNHFFKELIGFIVDRQMENQLIELSKAFTLLISRRLGIVFADVKTPYPLTEEEKNEIVKLIGGKAELRVEVDRSLIGGAVVFTSDGRCFDASIKGWLGKLREELAYA